MKLTSRETEVIAAAIAFHAPEELRHEALAFAGHWQEKLRADAVEFALKLFASEERRLLALLTPQLPEDEARGVAYDLAQVRNSIAKLKRRQESTPGP